MKILKRFAKRLVADPKTSASGIATLVAVGMGAAANPAILANPVTITTIITAVGLLFAADAKPESAPERPTTEEEKP